MNCISINSRGLGEDHKVAWIGRLKIRHKCSFIGIQETQMANIDAINVEGCWDLSELGHTAMGSSGRSGGLLSLWDANLYEVEEVIKDKHYLITSGKWDGIQGKTIFANIYGPHQPTEKKHYGKN